MSYFDTPLPHNDEAEAAVVGSAMVADDALRRELLATLRPEHFLTDDRRIVWQAIGALVARGVAVDAVTVRAELKERGRLEEVGGASELVAMLEGMDEDAVRRNPSWYTSRPSEHADKLDAIGRCLWDANRCGSSLPDVAAWVDRQADADARVIVVDPVSLADTSAQPWVEHDRFCRAVRQSIERADASLILATHPRGGHKNGPPTMDDLAGSRVFVRRADSILWLRRLGLRRAACVDGLTSDANQTTDYVDRVIRCLKCRDGSAAGLDFGLQ